MWGPNSEKAWANQESRNELHLIIYKQINFHSVCVTSDWYECRYNPQHRPLHLHPRKDSQTHDSLLSLCLSTKTNVNVCVVSLILHISHIIKHRGRFSCCYYWSLKMGRHHLLYGIMLSVSLPLYIQYATIFTQCMFCL